MDRGPHDSSVGIHVEVPGKGNCRPSMPAEVWDVVDTFVLDVGLDATIVAEKDLTDLRSSRWCPVDV